jgi:hypothetical protein
MAKAQIRLVVVGVEKKITAALKFRRTIRATKEEEEEEEGSRAHARPPSPNSVLLV